MSARPPLHIYLRQVWQRRHFIGMQAWATAMGQHQGTLLGNLWLIISPLMDGMVYFFIFGVLFGGLKANPNFFGYLIIGILMFSFTSRSITASTRCIHSDKGIIRAFNFPRAVLPIAAAWREVIALLPILYALTILLLVIPPKGKLGAAWLLMPAVIALQFMLNLGIGFVAARLGAYIPDLQYVVPYCMRMLLYLSAVTFAVERFDAHPPLDSIVRNNPLYLVLDMCRSILLRNEIPAAESWWTLLLWSGGTLVVGFVLFWHAEVTYASTALD